MDKIAVISDVHGCTVSLDAVLKDIHERKIDKIYCLGDLVAKGSTPSEAIDMVRKNCDIVLRGNCDETIAHGGHTEEHKWNKEKIGEERAEYLANLPITYTTHISGFKVVFAHIGKEVLGATIKLHNVDENTDREITKILDSFDADIVVVGHVHRPFIYRKNGKEFVCVGSVSNGCDLIEKNGKKIEFSSYCIIEGELGKKDELANISFEFVKIPYDYNTEVERLQNSDMPNKEMAIEELHSGIYTKR